MRNLEAAEERERYGTRLAISGADVRHIQELMGHSDITTTMRYMHVIPGGTRAVTRALEQFTQQRYGTLTVPNASAK